MKDISPEGLIAEQVFAHTRKTLSYLYDRWQDEQEYEDWDDYKTVIKKSVTEFPVVVTQVTKRPFGFRFSVNERSFKIFVTSRTIGWKRIK